MNHRDAEVTEDGKMGGEARSLGRALETNPAAPPSPSSLCEHCVSVVPTPPPLAGCVAGVGVDICDVGRIREMLARFPERLPGRVLSEREAAYCLARPDPAPHIAARFAAKEAVIKCLGGGCSLREIEVERALTGAPSICLHGRAKERAAGRRVLISLSHLDHLATAFAVLTDDRS